MQWNASLNAGFCSKEITTWLPVHANRSSVNVQDQLKDDQSLLNLYRNLLHLRQETPTLQSGSLEFVDDPTLDDQILAYKRTLGDQKLLILLNFSQEPVKLKKQYCQGKTIFRLGIDENLQATISQLPPYAGVIINLQ
jgi:oligo-1,6-glucosidase/alpha-glucosidase